MRPWFWSRRGNDTSWALHVAEKLGSYQGMASAIPEDLSCYFGFAVPASQCPNQQKGWRWHEQTQNEKAHNVMRIWAVRIRQRVPANRFPDGLELRFRSDVFARFPFLVRCFPTGPMRSTRVARFGWGRGTFETWLSRRLSHWLQSQLQQHSSQASLMIGI